MPLNLLSRNFEVEKRANGVCGAGPVNVWGVKCNVTCILHLLISVIRISDIGKSFSDIGKSSHFLISEIRITDIGNSISDIG